MADLTEIQSSQSVKIAGAGVSTGIETNWAAVDSNGGLSVAGEGTAGTPTGGVLTVQGVAGGTEQPMKDVIDSSMVNGAISVGTSAVEAKVGASHLTNRKVLVITPTNGTIYWGASGVTTTSGMPLMKNQSLTLAFTDNVSVFLIAATTINVRIVEGA